MATPINLMERFGKRYRIGWDESYNPKGRLRENLDPWAMEIPCRFGTIYPFDESRLCVMINHHRILAGMVGRLPGVELVQDGDHEKTFRFPVETFDQVAELVKPHRKPQLTEEQKRERIERLRPHWFDSRCATGDCDAPSPA